MIFLLFKAIPSNNLHTCFQWNLRHGYTISRGVQIYSYRTLFLLQPRFSSFIFDLTTFLTIHLTECFDFDKNWANKSFSIERSIAIDDHKMALLTDFRSKTKFKRGDVKPVERRQAKRASYCGNMFQPSTRSSMQHQPARQRLRNRYNPKPYTSCFLNDCLGAGWQSDKVTEFVGLYKGA